MALQKSKPLTGIIANYLATMSTILLGLWLYTRGDNFLSTNHDFRINLDVADTDLVVGTADLLLWCCGIYAIALIPYYASRPGFVCDARIVFMHLYAWMMTGTRNPFAFDDRRAVLTLALKLFFVPLMLAFLLSNMSEVMQHWRTLATEDPATRYSVQLNTSFYLLLLAVLYAIDVLIFTIGYLVEDRALNNEIRSVDPTALGWASCLVCYPPFNLIGLAYFSWQPTDASDFATPLIQAVLACISVTSVVGFVWASVALGLRASNLTNRGIVNWGPYRWVRHPAYTTKNIAAWIAALPVLADAFSKSIPDGLWLLTCVVAWTLIYVVRAVTEERHLLMIDNGYAEYKERVRYWFVPRVL